MRGSVHRTERPGTERQAGDNRDASVSPTPTARRRRAWTEEDERDAGTVDAAVAPKVPLLLKAGSPLAAESLVYVSIGQSG